MADPTAPERTPPDDTTREKLTHDDDGALTDLAMEASDAIRHFPFDDYGVTVGDPNDEDAEWVFELAVAATEAVLRGQGLSLKQAATTLLADKATPPDDTTEPTTTEDRYWQAEAQRARAERDALALGVLRLADAWVKEFGETGIRPEVCAATIRSAVETMGWH